MMKTRFTKFLAILLAVVMTIGLMPMGAIADTPAASYSDKEAATAATNVTADKTISGPNADGNYTITLSAVGQTSSSSITNKLPADVVLVIDSSGSMDWCGGTYTKTKDNFKRHNHYYDEYTCQKCGHVVDVKHGDPAPQYCTQTDTTTPDRIYNAKEAAKSFVSGLLSDNPNIKIGLCDFSDDSYSTYFGFSNTFVRVDLTQNQTTLTNSIDAIQTGGGTNYTYGLDEAASILAQDTSSVQKFVVFISDGQPNEDGEGYLMTGATVFTVGIDVTDSAMSDALKAISSSDASGNKYYYSGSSDALTSILNTLKTTIISQIYSGTNAVMTDTINLNDFTVVTAPSGTDVTYNNGVATWNIGDIGSTQKTLTFVVKPIAGHYGILHTNNDVSLTFDSTVLNTNVTFTEGAIGDPTVEIANPTHNVKYMLDGTQYGAIDTETENNSVSVRPAPEARPGYTFSGWTTTDATIANGSFTMPAADVTITGSFKANDNTAYKVEHYKQDLGAETYTLADTDSMTGTTGATTAAAAKDYAGFTVQAFDQATIAADGSTVVKIYYNRDSFKVTYTYTGDVPAGATALPAEATYQYGASVTVADAATATGYTFSGWSTTGTFDMPANNVTITGSFEANDNTAYKVEHYKQDLGAETYTLADTDSMTGTTGATTAAAAKEYAGFTVQAFEQATIAGDGSTVVKIYYNRDSFKVTYEYTGDVPAGATALPAEATYQYGASVTVAAAATATGYTFSGWSTKDFTMPAADVTITGSFKANDNTAYKVEHYKQDLGAETYTLADTDNMTGTTGATTAAAAKDYAGFTVQAFDQATIAADGSTVVKIYYNRDSFKVTYTYTGDVPAGATALPAEATYQYGASVTVADAATATGYTFSGWSTTGTFDMPANNVTITGSFEANDNTAYKVEHYKQDLGAETYTLADTDSMTGTTGATTAAAAKEYAGFTVQAFEQATIAGDGSTVVKIYYNRDSFKVTYEYTGDVPAGATALPAEATYQYGASVTVAAAATATGYTFSGWSTKDFTMPAADVTITGSFKANDNTAYKVEHYKQDLGAETYTLADTDNMTGTTGATTAAAAKDYAGFTVQAFDQATIAADGSTVVKIYYNRDSFKVTYTYTGDVPAGATALPAEATYQYGASVTVADAATATGYTFSGWSTTGTFDMPANNVTITGSFKANDNTAYKVEHYKQDLGAETYTLADTDSMTGTTGATTAAAAKEYAGFTVQAFEQATIAGDGSTVVKIYYNRDSFKVTYEYTGDVPAGATALPAEATYQYGASVTVAAAATATGYTFSGWSTKDFTMPAADVTITGSFKANDNTAYKVEHYKQDLGAETYTLADTDNMTGTTGATTAAAAKDYAGFTVQAFDQATIAGDGSTVVKIYYNRDSFKVTYEYTGDVPAGATALPAEATYQYGASVTVAAAATATGYTFSGWSTKDFTMPAADVTITGSFKANDNTAYKVEHYKQDLGAETYTLADTDNMTGTTGATTAAAAKDYAGFTVQAFDQATIAGDGSTVVKIYYNRDSFKVTYEYTGDVPAGATALPAEATYQYGASVTVAAAATATGYTFSGWSTKDFTMPAADVTITGSFKANDNTAYKVEHYKQDLGAETYTLADTDNMTGTTGATTAAAAKDYAGFTVQAFDQATIAADGSTVVKIYYNRDSFKVTYEYTGDVPAGATDLPAEATYQYGASVTVAAAATATGYTFSGWSTKDFTMPAADVTITGSFKANDNTAYKVEHYKQDLGAETYTLADTDNMTGTTGATTAAAAKDYAGFTVQSFEQATIAGDGSTVVKIYYNRDSFKVTYEYTGDVPAGATDLPAEATYQYGASVTVAAAATATGYTFSGWSTKDFTMPAADVTITGSFKANDNTAYKVEHYKQDLGAETYTLADTDNMTGTTGATTAAAAKDYAGFTVQSFEQATIAGDGSTVVKIYYNRDSFKVTYEYTGDVPAGATDLPAEATYQYGASVTVADAATATGYTFSGWSTKDFTMPAADVTITGSFKANDNTAYKVEHYKQDLGAETYTLADTDNMTGTTGATTAAAAKDYAGFTVQSFEQATIAGDGSTVVKIYYNRNSYIVTWVDEDNKTLGTKTFAYGTDAATVKGAEPSNPTKTADNTYTYTFAGWTPAYATVTDNQTYTATYTPSYINYTVTFKDYDGTVISSNDTYHYGDAVTTPANPTRHSDASYTYSFAGWTPTVVTTVKGNAIYTATYNSNEEHYNVNPEIPTGLNGIDHIAYIIGRNGLSKPNATITRAEVASIFFRLLTDEMRQTYLTSESSFSDVHKGDWYNTMVDTLTEMGIIKGYADGTFRPNAPITRAEFAAIAARFDSTDITGKTATFTDIANCWAKSEIERTAILGWTNGYADGSFRPNNDITRAEVATLVNRVLKRQPGKPEDLLDDMVKWPDNMDTTAWYYLAIQEASNSHDYDKYTIGTEEYEKWKKLNENPNWVQYQH
jgi:uncharacterized repeat protein (TIGR02543 family)